jgi:tellurite resistance protein TerC
VTTRLAAEHGPSFVALDVQPWHWAVLLGTVAVLLLVDLLVLHREAHVISPREAVVESAAWISIGLGFALLVWLWFGGTATTEYLSGYLVEQSLSVDNVFVWAIILGSFAVPAMYQHRVLFWGIFGALALRAVFVFAGIALIERFEWVLYLFGAFLIVTAVRLLVSDDEEFEPGESRVLRVVGRVVPSTPHLDGARLFTRVDGRRLATPLFAVLVLVEMTDLLFAVDSVPAVLAVSQEQFLVLSSNAFAILGLRSMYFLLADLRGRFRFLQPGLAVILAFVGGRMVLSRWVAVPTAVSLVVIAAVLVVAVGASWRFPGPAVEPHEPVGTGCGPA